MSIYFTAGDVNFGHQVKLVIFQVVYYFSPLIWIGILWEIFQFHSSILFLIKPSPTFLNIHWLCLPVLDTIAFSGHK